MELTKSRTRKVNRGGPSSHKLREDLRQQMGVANLYLAKGKVEEAIDLCMEIVRQGRSVFYALLRKVSLFHYVLLTIHLICFFF